MAALTDKFDVLKGWEPGGDASVDQSYAIHKVMGVPVTLLPGYIVELSSSSDIDVASTPDLSMADRIQVYVVVEGNGADFSPQFVEKAVVLRGKLTVKTDKVAALQTFPVAGPVTFNSGLLEDKGANDQIIGYVIENNMSTDGTITVGLDL